MPPHEQTLGVHAVGRARHECDEVLALHGLQRLGLVGVHHEDLVHLVGKRAVEHVQIEMVALLELVEVGEEARARQAAMRRKHAVGGLAADGQGRALQMPHAAGQRLLGGAVVDGQRLADLGNLDIAHHPVAAEGKLGEVVRTLRLGVHGEGVGDALARERSVVGVGLGKPRVVLRRSVVRRRRRGHALVVLAHELGLPPAVPRVGDERVQQDGKPRHKDEAGDDVYEAAAIHVLNKGPAARCGRLAPNRISSCGDGRRRTRPRRRPSAPRRPP